MLSGEFSSSWTFGFHTAWEDPSAREDGLLVRRGNEGRLSESMTVKWLGVEGGVEKVSALGEGDAKSGWRAIKEVTEGVSVGGV